MLGIEHEMLLAGQGAVGLRESGVARTGKGRLKKGLGHESIKT
jgi:hypothetical protein